MKLNEAAYKHAESIILQGKVDSQSTWSKDKPNQSSVDEFLSKQNWQTYGKWFLAYDPALGEGNKDAYDFLYGDFEKVHRSALLAIQEIAQKQNHTDILMAVKELLREIDKEPDKVDIASEESFPASDPPN